MNENPSWPTTQIPPVDKTHGVLALGCWTFGGQAWGGQDDADSLAAMEAALANVEKMRQNAEKIRKDRRYLSGQLEELGFDVLPSEANFVFARPPMPAGVLFAKLKERKILVRYWDRPRLADGIRISIGTRQELDALLAATTEILAEA